MLLDEIYLMPPLPLFQSVEIQKLNQSINVNGDTASFPVVFIQIFFWTKSKACYAVPSSRYRS